MYTIKIQRRLEEDHGMIEVFGPERNRQLADWIFAGATIDSNIAIVELYYYDKVVQRVSKILEEKI